MSTKNRTKELIAAAEVKLADDRDQIKDFADQLLKAFKLVGGDADPMAKIGIAEQFARISGELTKNNALFVELAKIEAKRELRSNEDEEDFDDDETDALFDAISGDGVEGKDDPTN